MKKFVEFSVYLCIAGAVFAAFYWHKSVHSETIKEERHPGIHPSTWNPSDNWKIRKIVQIETTKKKGAAKCKKKKSAADAK
jgi:hypothetical protein